MIVYYDITVWENVEIGDTDTLKTRYEQFGKALKDFGILSYKIRTEADESPQGDEQSTNEPTS